jgi:hypothetical protein
MVEDVNIGNVRSSHHPFALVGHWRRTIDRGARFLAP